jgi:CRP-like cAMP-binding protein
MQSAAAWKDREERSRTAPQSLTRTAAYCINEDRRPGEVRQVGRNDRRLARISLPLQIARGKECASTPSEVDFMPRQLREKRLARLLLLLANFGKEGRPQPVVAKISQETLAEMIGTTRSRVSFFMNKFRRLGFIEYTGTSRCTALC